MKNKSLFRQALAVLAAGLLILPQTAFAQNKVSGTVKDSWGDPVIGAAVVQKGTTNGISTSEDGTYSISVPAGAILQFSCVGYKTVEMTVTGETLDAVLEDDVDLLEGVVVVGYGTQKKANLTGSVASVSSRDIEDIPAANAASLLQGRLPGVVLTSNGGQAGKDNPEIRVRGVGTLSGNNNPMVIIDGIEAGVDDIRQIAAADIDNVSVLKDAASAAIYGVRAANGVILITTKRGFESAPKVNYSGNFTLQKAAIMPDYVDSCDWALMYNELTMTYNDVPYLKGEQSITDANCPKTARAEIVADLVNDVKAAVADLPDDVEFGRMTKGAALSILGRIALYNSKWDEAVSAYEQVVSMGRYSLFGDYSTLFSAANETCPEIIFSIRYEGPGVSEGNSIAAHWDTPLEAMNGTVDLADQYYVKSTGLKYADDEIYNDPASKDLWNVRTDRYEDRDPRLYATLFVPGMAWGSKNWLYGGAAASLSTVYVQKYFTADENSSTSWDSGKDFYVVRYAEVLLSLAEAYIEKGTKLTEAVSLIDQVRARVGMPSVGSVEKATTAAALREVVRHERRVELAFEGLRLYDLYRWELLKDAVDRINAEKTRYGFNYETRHFRGPQEYVWPLPQAEIDSNKELVQNALWGGE